MKAFVLAAGKGERLNPLTLDTPKPLLPVGGEPIIHRVIKMLARDGFDDIVINLHHLGDQIRESTGDGSRFGVRIKYSHEEKIMGTGGGIKAAQDLIGKGTFLVINADVLIDIDLRKVFKYHKERGGAATLVLRDDSDEAGYGAIKIDNQGRIRDILGTSAGNHGELLPRLFTGIQVLEPVFFDYLPPGEWASSTRDVFPEMMKEGLEFFACEHRGFFLDIGTPERYSRACEEIKNIP